ncbi:MAG TPA: hypothetical protein VKR55_15860 [Bradyrhizobium sp.]|uniref:hypothetical protein n=1 Tax=Bradyrhizobium sp. TaxID=376 RepID=UPI002C93B6C4|nr:hypothetical protein [Bradyrhizobium sp.]HLZ03610.1 hypothetical protein [Bradyrhizobium sp.]
MVRHAVALAAVLTIWGQGALASEKPTVLRRLSCTLVRYYVAKYSEAAAEGWARSHGATDAQIETARRCLGSSVQTTSFAAK